MLKMLAITPRHLAYVSIIMGGVVLLSTIAIIIFPAFFKRFGTYFARKSADCWWKLNIAFFINDVINPLSVALFYGLIGVILTLFGEYKILGISLCSIISASIWFWTVKRITQRPRPENAKIKFKDFSFPSGHTTAGFVFFLSIALAVSRILGNTFREIAYLLALFGGSLVARSRRYLQVHRFTDVIIGAFLGIGCFLFSYLLFFYFWDAMFSAIEQVFFSL